MSRFFPSEEEVRSCLTGLLEPGEQLSTVTIVRWSPGFWDLLWWPVARIVPGGAFLDSLWVKQYVLGVSDRRLVLARVAKTSWTLQRVESYPYREMSGARYSHRLVQSYLYLSFASGRRLTLKVERGGSLQWQNDAARVVASTVWQHTEGRPVSPANEEGQPPLGAALQVRTPLTCRDMFYIYLLGGTAIVAGLRRGADSPAGPSLVMTGIMWGAIAVLAALLVHRILAHIVRLKQRWVRPQSGKG